MPVHTRTRRTKSDPKKVVKSKVKIRTKKPREKSISWREAFKEEIEKYSEAGLMLRGSRRKESLTQTELAKIMGISQHHISEMENGKRSIGKEMAKRLAEFFKTDYRVFL